MTKATEARSLLSFDPSQERKNGRIGSVGPLTDILSIKEEREDAAQFVETAHVLIRDYNSQRPVIDQIRTLMNNKRSNPDPSRWFNLVENILFQSPLYQNHPLTPQRDQFSPEDKANWTDWLDDESLMQHCIEVNRLIGSVLLSETSS